MRLPGDPGARWPLARPRSGSSTSRDPGDPSSRSIVSHFNKATKGRLLRDLLESGTAPRTPRQLARTLASLGYTVEGTPPERPGRAWSMDVVVAAL